MIKKLSLILLLAFATQVHSAPLEGRKYGVEFNFPRAIAFSKDWKSMSGTFSYFNHRKNAEIAVPWMITKEGRGEDALLVSSVDLHYRHFLNSELNGFYLSAFTRLANYDGTTYSNNDYAYGGDNYKGKKKETNVRVGVGVGLGYRLFPEKSRIYWGAGFAIGRYLDYGDTKYINEDFGSELGTPLIVEAELLKFGYAF
jgi:hypothetical protein